MEDKTKPSIGENDISFVVNSGKSYYADRIKSAERDINAMGDRINIKLGTKEVETGLAPPSQWDLMGDKQRAQTDQTLQVARVVKVQDDIPEPRYMISIRQMAKFIVGKSKKLDASEIQEGIRIGVDRMKYSLIQPLPRKIDASVTMMQVEEKPDVTYSDLGGCKD